MKIGQRMKPAWLGGLAALLWLTAACSSQPTPTATVVPTASPPATMTAAPSPSPTATVAPTATPTPTVEPTPNPTLAALRLEVTSPADNSVVNRPTVTVAGETNPDATVSVNGQLVTPDPTGHFSTDLTISEAENPLLIEVVASDFSGQQLSVTRTVIYAP